jgi:hypothetical protein
MCVRPALAEETLMIQDHQHIAHGIQVPQHPEQGLRIGIGRFVRKRHFDIQRAKFGAGVEVVMAGDGNQRFAPQVSVIWPASSWYAAIGWSGGRQ